MRMYCHAAATVERLRRCYTTFVALLAGMALLLGLSAGCEDDGSDGAPTAPAPQPSSEWSPLADADRPIIPNPPLGQRAYRLSIPGFGTLQFLLHLPSGYASQQAWPLILFLHGSGEVGTDPSVLTKLGPSGYAEGLPSFPFIVLSPQLSVEQWWDPAVLDVLLTHIVRHYRVDQDRMIVTGLSLGGYGTWSMAVTYPTRFSCAVPVAGGGDPAAVCRIAHLPVWVFHGANDTAVPVGEAQAMVNALRACGGNVQFTVYPERGHDSWNPTYTNPDVFDWMAAQRRIGS